ncbi:MAG: hypothetical protein F4Y45_16620 [Acidobacteria bacterium]|nr:hypothetical protein [Acidobacteriota bacterium]MYJ05136.1 hypothetical protein [Acidobacteriota bacterium]
MTAAPSARRPDYVRRHLRFGFWALALFLTLGATLEALHGFKVGFYLDVSNETRRLMWTLAHAHGALLSLINVVAGVTLRAVPELAEDHRRTGLASTMLMAATILLPAGFFAGGVTFYSGDPGIGIALVPPGAACLLIAVVQLARGSAEVRR